MAYLVEITPRAERDLGRLYEQSNAVGSAPALTWYLNLKKRILSLEHSPHRCPIIRVQGKLRHLLHGRKPHVYRVIYRVLERRELVEILHVRHGARREPKRSDLA